jgi:hypothetical protein
VTLESLFFFLFENIYKHKEVCFRPHAHVTKEECHSGKKKITEEEYPASPCIYLIFCFVQIQ